MKKVSEGINRRIRVVRQRHGLTQEKFALDLGITPQYLSMVETGARNPSYALILGILYKFGGTEGWLVGRFPPE